MRTAQWNDYELLDTSAGERLERWGDVILIRPDPQIIWNTEKKHPLWRRACALFALEQRRRPLGKLPRNARQLADSPRCAHLSAQADGL